MRQRKPTSFVVYLADPLSALMQVKLYRLGICQKGYMKQDTTLTRARTIAVPFAVPSNLDGGLVPVRNYWLKLRRGQADIPFADDVKMSELDTLDADLMIIEVFEHPTRFRIGIASRGLARRYGQLIEGLFADEIVPRPPLEYLVSQCSATVEGRAPTFYHAPSLRAYGRLLLPLWGDGHINALLGAVITR